MNILFVDILTDDRILRRQIEQDSYASKTYAERCRQAFGVKPDEWTVVYANRDPLPDPKQFDQIVIGGSVENPVNPKEDKPWMKKTFAYIRRIIKADVPMLGICGGLQFTARALGGEIIWNPRGRRIGTQIVTLTAAGKKNPLFAGLPSRFRQAATHRCIVKKMLPGWTVLATSALSPYDAIAIGPRIVLTQFHPEMSRRTLATIVRRRRVEMKREGLKRPALRLPIGPSKKILTNFLSIR